MKLPPRFPLITTVLYVVVSELIFYYSKSGGYQHVSINQFICVYTCEVFHMTYSEQTILLYLLLSGLLIFFILSNVESAAFRYLFIGLLVLISLPVLNARNL